jgi:hypothetical protein
MRSEIIVAAALAVMSTTGARADEWCGYAAQQKSLIECGYSSVTECENAIGKGGMCFVDPDYALNSKPATPSFPAKHPAAPAGGNRSG